MAQNDVEAKVKIVVDSKAFNAALKQANKEAKEFKRQQSSAFKSAGDDISKAFGSAIGAVTKLAPALSAGAAAMAVAKKAMQENQRLTDGWARVTESAKASWEGFVDALVNADFGSYFSNMDSLIRRASEAADAIDRLDTTKIFTSKAMAEYDLQIARAKNIIKNPNSTVEQVAQANRDIETAQAGKLASVQRLSDDYLRSFASQLADYVTRKGYNATEGDFVEQGADGRWRPKAGSLFDKYYGSLTTYENMSALYDLERRRRGGKLTDAEVAMGADKRWLSNSYYSQMSAFLELSDPKLKEVFEKYESALREQQKVYVSMNENFEYLNRANNIIAGGKVSKGGGGVSTSKVGEVFAEGSIGWVEQEVAKANKEWKSAVTEGECQAAQARLKVLQEELEVLKSGKISTGKLSPLGVDTPTGLFNPTDITAPTWRANIDIKQQKTLGKVTEDALQRVSNLTDVIGKLGITSHFVSPEVSKVTNIIGRVLSTIGGAVGGPWGMALQGIGGIVGSFDTGGIVGGTSYKGDKLTAQVSSGEMILNKAQQRNLLAIAGGGGAPSVTAVEVRGDKMVLLINNTLRQQGKSTIG